MGERGDARAVGASIEAEGVQVDRGRLLDGLGLADLGRELLGSIVPRSATLHLLAGLPTAGRSMGSGGRTSKRSGSSAARSWAASRSADCAASAASRAAVSSGR